MAHKFTKPLERLSDPRSLEDVSRLIAGNEEGHKVTNQFYYNGVLILEVVSKPDSRFTRNDKNKSERESEPRRILILGHTVDSDDLVALQIKHKNKSDPWISHGLRFGSQKVDPKQIHHPGVAWCKGLAMVHTGSSFAYGKTKVHRMKQVTELMQLVCDKSVAWRELDFDALKVCRDNGLA